MLCFFQTEPRSNVAQSAVFLQVAGPLVGYVVERISVGIQHVAALASPADKRTGLPQVGLNEVFG